MQLMKAETNRDSFLLRIWQKDPHEWRVWVQHVRSGQTAVVRSQEELWTFIERVVNRQERQQPTGIK